MGKTETNPGTMPGVHFFVMIVGVCTLYAQKALYLEKLVYAMLAESR